MINMKEKIELDEDGFPEASIFHIPVLKILKNGNYTEEQISAEMINYFNFNEEQINQKVETEDENKEPKTKLESHTHWAIAHLEISGCVKKENKTYSIEYKGEQILKMGIEKLTKTELEKLVKRLDLIGILRVLSNLKSDVSSIRLSSNHFNRYIDGLSEHFKTFVKRNNINDYDNQEGGGGNRKKVTTYTFINNEKIEFTLSLYRTTRHGVTQEPRINFIGKNSAKLWSSIKPGLFLFTIVNEELYLLNLSDNQTLNSLLSQTGAPYETLKKGSYKKINEKVKSFYEHLKKLNDRKYFILNSEYPNINSVLKKEGFVLNNSHKYQFKQMEFEVLDEKNATFDKNADNILFNFIVNGEEDYVKEYNGEYFVNNPNLQFSSRNPEINPMLKIDFERGLLKAVDRNVGDVLILDFENILDNIEGKFNLLYKNIITNYGDEYVIFEKVFSYSKPNFGLLCFLMMDDFFKEKYDINIELILDTEFNDNLLSCSLILELKDDEILKTIFYPIVFNLKDEL